MTLHSNFQFLVQFVCKTTIRPNMWGMWEIGQLDILPNDDYNAEATHRDGLLVTANFSCDSNWSEVINMHCTFVHSGRV